MKDQKKRRKKIKKGWWSKGIIGGIILGLLFLAGLFFYQDWTLAESLKTLNGILPWPIAFSNNRSVLVTNRDLQKNLQAVEHFYSHLAETQKGLRVDFRTPAGKVRLLAKEREVLNKLIEDDIIRYLAQQRGIYINDQEVEAALEETLRAAKVNKEQLVVNLQASYGWSLKEFKEVIKKQLYLQKLWEWYQTEMKNSDLYEKMAALRDDLKQGKKEFAQVARQVSEGESAKQQGEINWLAEEDIIPEVREALDNLKPGEISPVIVSPLGLHLVLLEEKRVSTSGSIDQQDATGVKEDQQTPKVDVQNKKKDKAENQLAQEEERENKSEGDGLIRKEFKFRQIFWKKKGFLEWLTEQKKRQPVKILWRRYQWLPDKGGVDFRNPAWREKVKKVLLLSSGDPSVGL